MIVILKQLSSSAVRTCPLSFPFKFIGYRRSRNIHGRAILRNRLDCTKIRLDSRACRSVPLQSRSFASMTSVSPPLLHLHAFAWFFLCSLPFLGAGAYRLGRSFSTFSADPLWVGDRHFAVEEGLSSSRSTAPHAGASYDSLNGKRDGREQASDGPFSIHPLLPSRIIQQRRARSPEDDHAQEYSLLMKQPKHDGGKTPTSSQTAGALVPWKPQQGARQGLQATPGQWFPAELGLGIVDSWSQPLSGPNYRRPMTAHVYLEGNRVRWRSELVVDERPQRFLLKSNRDMPELIQFSQGDLFLLMHLTVFAGKGRGWGLGETLVKTEEILQRFEQVLADREKKVEAKYQALLDSIADPPTEIQKMQSLLGRTLLSSAYGLFADQQEDSSSSSSLLLAQGHGQQLSHVPHMMFTPGTAPSTPTAIFCAQCIPGTLVCPFCPVAGRERVFSAASTSTMGEASERPLARPWPIDALSITQHDAIPNLHFPTAHAGVPRAITTAPFPQQLVLEGAPPEKKLRTIPTSSPGAGPPGTTIAVPSSIAPFGQSSSTGSFSLQDASRHDHVPGSVLEGEAPTTAPVGEEVPVSAADADSSRPSASTGGGRGRSGRIGDVPTPPEEEELPPKESSAEKNRQAVIRKHLRRQLKTELAKARSLPVRLRLERKMTVVQVAGDRRRRYPVELELQRFFNAEVALRSVSGELPLELWDEFWQFEERKEHGGKVPGEEERK